MDSIVRVNEHFNAFAQLNVYCDIVFDYFISMQSKNNHQSYCLSWKLNYNVGVSFWFGISIKQ